MTMVPSLWRTDGERTLCAKQFDDAVRVYERVNREANRHARCTFSLSRWRALGYPPSIRSIGPRVHRELGRQHGEQAAVDRAHLDYSPSAKLTRDQVRMREHCGSSPSSRTLRTWWMKSAAWRRRRAFADALAVNILASWGSGRRLHRLRRQKQGEILIGQNSDTR
jgi:hypothetical protein